MSGKKKLFLLTALAVIIIGLPLIILSIRAQSKVKAFWWLSPGSTWQQRKQLTLTNNSGATLDATAVVAVTVDTKALYNSGKLQADCDDLRIVYQPSTSTATELTRHLVYAQGTTCATSAATKVNFALQANLSDSGTSSYYYLYYNSPDATAPSGTDSAFDIGAVDATLVCPFEGSTTCAAGETPSTETGAIRYSGAKSAMSFDGVNDYISAGNVGTGIKTVEFWVYPNSTTNYFIDLNTSAYIQASAGTISATGFTGATIYVNGVATTTIAANAWSHVAVATDTAVTASAVNIGLISTNYFNGRIDEVRLSNSNRYAASFTPQTSPFIRDSNTKLLLHFDENGDDPRNTGKAIDDSGNANHGTITGAKYVAGLVGVDGSNGSVILSGSEGSLSNQSYAGHGGIFIEEGTTNKITNPSFDNSTYNANWDAVGANLTASENTTAPYYKFGSKSLKLIASASAVDGASNMDTIGIDPNSTASHTFSFYAYDGTSGNIGGTISASIVKPIWEGVAQAGGTYTDMGGGWWRVTYATTTTDSTNEYGIEIQVSKTVYIDGVQLEALAYATTYADGSLGTGYAWTGTANNSTTTRTGVRFRYSSTSNISASAGTISLWVKPVYVPAVNSVWNMINMSNGGGGGGGAGLGITIQNAQYRWWYGTKDAWTGTPTVNKWQHLVLNWKASTNTAKIYIDGSLISTKTDLDTINLGDIAVGCAPYDWDVYQAASVLSDLRIYSSDLTDNQVSDLYYAGLLAHSEAYVVDYFDSETGRGQAPNGAWHFDEGQGTTAHDSSIYANNGTLGTGTSAPTWQTEDMCVLGKCLKFDGNDSIQVADNSTLNITEGLTVSLWAKFNDVTGYRYIVSKDTVSSGFVLTLYNNSKLTGFIYDSGGWRYSSGDTTLQNNTWYYLTMVYDRSTTTLYYYVNGRLDGSTTSPTGDIITNSNPLYIGRDSSADQYYVNGFLDEVQIYPYARTQAQILVDYNGGAVRIGSQMPGPLGNGLVGYYKLESNSSDSSGNSNNGTDTNINYTSTGKFGNAAGISPTPGGISLPTTTLGALGTGDFGFAGWYYLKQPEAGSYPMIFGSYDTISPFTGPTLFYDPLGVNGLGNAMLVRVTGTNNQVITSPSASSLYNTWTHIAFTRKSGTCNVYYNGSLVLSFYDNTSIATPGAFWILSRGNSASQSASTGTLGDDLRIYNRALSPAEVRQLYNWAPGPVAHWKMDEGTGQSANDSSGNANTGTISGATWTTGKYGKGLSFDGVDDYVDAGSTSLLSSQTNFTISGWTKRDTDVAGMLYAEGNTGDNNPIINLGWDSNGRIEIVRRDGSAVGLVAYSTETLSRNTWQHIAFVNLGTTYYLYLNGVQIKTDTYSAPGTITLNAVRLGIRKRISNDAPVDGLIDDVRIYNYARTQKQITEDMRGDSTAVSAGGGIPASSKPAAPVAYYKFNEGADNTCSGGVNDVCNAGSGGSSLDGAQSGMSVPATAASGWTNSGKYGKALIFDGTDDYVDTGLGAGNALGTSNITVSMWLKVDTFTEGGLINMGSFASAYGQFWVRAGPSSAILYGLNSVGYSGSFAFTDTSSWHHFVFTHDGSRVKVYLDNVLKDDDAYAASVDYTGQKLVLGGYYAPDYTFDGSIDDVKIYNYALTQDEILADYNQGSALVLGALGNLSTLSNNAAGQQYCVPGDSTSCTSPSLELKFDEGTGTSAKDTSGNGYTGTITGPDWVSGKIGKALKFGGAAETDNVYSAGSSIDTSANKLSVEAWVKVLGINNGFFHLISDIGNYNTWLGIGTCCGEINQQFFFGSAGGACSCANVVGAAQVTTLNQWTHVAGTYDGTTIKIYINGVLTNSKAASSWTLTNPLSKYIVGVDANLSGGFNGLIDDYKVYNYARTPAQIAWDYNRGGPVGWWKMDECSGTTAYDASGNSNNGTITIGATGTNSSAGTCSGSAGEAWKDGASGKYNASLEFDGTDDYVSLPNLGISGSLPRTVSFWANFDSGKSTLQMPFTWGGGSTRTAFLIAFDVNNDDIYVASVTNDLHTTDYIVTRNAWHHIVVTYAGGLFNTTNAQIYVDGKIKTLTLVGDAGALNTADTGYAIGYDPLNAGRNVSGQIDDVRIYNYALTATQVKMLFNEGGAVRFGPSTGNP